MARRPVRPTAEETRRAPAEVQLVEAPAPRVSPPAVPATESLDRSLVRCIRKILALVALSMYVPVCALCVISAVRCVTL